MKKPEEVMEILEAFDLAGSLRGAAVLAGCDHKTVGHWVRARDAAGGGSRRRCVGVRGWTGSTARLRSSLIARVAGFALIVCTRSSC